MPFTLKGNEVLIGTARLVVNDGLDFHHGDELVFRAEPDVQSAGK